MCSAGRRRDALDGELGERAAGAADRGLPVLAPHHDLRQQRVVERRDGDVGLQPGVDRAPTARPAAPAARPAAGRRAGSRASGSSAFTRNSIACPRAAMSCLPHGRSGSPAAIRSCSATRSMPVTSSVVGCSTWMRVFISMKKNSPRHVVDEELDGAGAAVADLAGEPHRRRGHRLPRTCDRCPGRAASSTTFCRRRCSEHSRSNRCTTSAAVAEHLHLDVPGPADEPLQVHPPVAERARRLPRRGRERRAQPGLVVDDADAAPAATRGRLEHDRVADRPRRPRRPRRRPSTPPGVPGTVGTPGGRGHLAGGRPCRPSARSPPRPGPTNVSPASTTAAANAARSDRNP